MAHDDRLTVRIERMFLAAVCALGVVLVYGSLFHEASFHVASM